MKLILLTFLLLIGACLSSSKAQSVTEYTVGAIPNISRFEPMASFEVDEDTSRYNDDNAMLVKMLNGSAFEASVSPKERIEAIQYHKITTRRYKDNRSRYYMNLYVNGEKDSLRFASVDTLTSECDAYLNDGTIRLGMGIWGMGGFSFLLDISKVGFTSAYWEDAHQHPIYKKSLNDKNWTDNVLVDMNEQSLILNYTPDFSVGEELSGYYTFNTKDYYRIANYDVSQEAKSKKDSPLDELRLQGVIYFKCKVRQKTDQDE